MEVTPRLAHIRRYSNNHREDRLSQNRVPLAGLTDQIRDHTDILVTQIVTLLTAAILYICILLLYL